MTRFFLIVSFVLFSSSAFAAITHDATSAVSDQTNVQNPSYTHTRGATCANPVAIIGVTYQDTTPGTISSVTYNGVAATQLGTTKDTTASGNKDFVNLWIVKGSANVPSGGSTVQANFSEVMNEVMIHTSTYCGVHQTNTTGTAVGSSNADTTVTSTVTSATGELVVDVAVITGTRTLTVGAGQTQRANTQGAVQVHVGSEEAGAASVVMSWTISSGQSWAQVAVPLKPAATSRPVAPILLQ